jgi:acyl-CoA thioesterase
MAQRPDAPGSPRPDGQGAPPPAGADLLESVRERARTNLFWRYLGVEVVDARPGWARLRVPVRDELRNATGAPVHGGVMSALVDMSVGGALSTMHEASAGGVGQTTLDLNVSFIGGASGAEIFAEGRILRRGRSIAFGEATITDAEARLVAVGRATYMILPAR